MDDEQEFIQELVDQLMDIEPTWVLEPIGMRRRFFLLYTVLEPFVSYHISYRGTMFIVVTYKGWIPVFQFVVTSVRI